MSTALEAASLIMIPTSYSDGLLASVKPNDGAGDFTFSRGSNISATRVNADGYIEKGYENLLLQSNTFSDAAWSLNRANVTGGQAGYDGTNDAWLLNRDDIDTDGVLIRFQSLNSVQTLSVYAKANTLNWIRIRIGTGGRNAYFDLSNGTTPTSEASIESVGNGWYRCSIWDSYSSDRYRIYPADGYNDTSGTSGSIYIQDAMLNQGLVAYPYVETTTAPVAAGILEDMPRIDFSGGNQSLLLEPSRANLWLNSEYLAAAKSQNTGSSVTQNTSETLSPEGLYNASKFSGVGDFWLWRDFIAVQNVTSTISCYVKAVTSGSNNTFRLSIAGQISADLTATDEWQRFSYTALGAAQATGLLRDSSGNDADLYIYGFQAEQDATYPTSYIPTYGVSQTRLADVCSKDNISGLINSPDGVFYNEVVLESTPLTGNRHLIVRGDASNYVNVYFDTIGSIVARIKVAGVDTFLSTPITQVQNKVAILWQANKYALFVNGVKAAENLSGATFPAGTLNKIDFDNVNSNTPFYGEVKQTLLFPTALSDDECITLTTI